MPVLSGIWMHSSLSHQRIQPDTSCNQRSRRGARSSSASCKTVKFRRATTSPSRKSALEAIGQLLIAAPAPAT